MIAELVGTSSKMIGDIGEIKQWVSLCCQSAKVNWEKVANLEEGKAIRYNVSPYVLKISNPSEVVIEVSSINDLEVLDSDIE